MKYLVSILLFLILFSCENNNEPGKSTIIEGESTVKSDSLPFFSFKVGKAFDYPTNEDITDDFLMMIMINERGYPMGIGFIADHERETFSVLYPQVNIHYDNLDTALQIFDTLSILDNDLYYTYGIGVNQGQILAVKTKDNKYALMVITEAKYYRDTTDTNSESYDGYVTFKWKYQTNGTRNFNEK
jgi:hypothetical protein